MKVKLTLQEMATEENTPVPKPAIQESEGESHSPQQSVRRPINVEEAHAVVAQRERRYDKLRKMGAEDFRGTTNPLEAERWLQRTERIFEMMYYTLEEKLDYAVSLLQEDAYDWWETIPHSRTRPWVLGYEDFIQVFGDLWICNVYRHLP